MGTFVLYLQELNIIGLVWQLFQTLCIMFTVATVFYYNFGTSHLQSESGFNKIGIFFFLGLSILTMILAVRVAGYPGLMLNLRAVPIILSAIYLKPQNGLLVAVATVLMRYYWGEAGAELWIVGAATYFFTTLLIYKRILPSAARSVRVYLISVIAVIITFLGYTVASLYLESFRGSSLFASQSAFTAVWISILITVPIATVIMDTVLQRHLNFQNKYILYKYNANRDGLTGLYNRRGFDELFNQSLDTSEQLTVLMIDIDSFKSYNDEFGHDQGDLVLKKIAEIIRSKTRKTDVAARYGGEEFVIAIPEINESMAYSIAEGIRKAMMDCTEFNRKVTVSIGVASYPQFDRKTVTKMSDIALYKAKETRNSVISAGMLVARK